MSKKTWILITCLVLSLAMGLGGSLAYLTDRDADVNVFTMGNVDIDLTEDFEQGSELMPGKDITKDVKVKNIGKNDAWVWVQIALPAELDNTDPSLNVLHFNYSKESVGEGQWKWLDSADWSNVPTTDIDGVTYKVYTVLYQSPLAPETETPYSAMTKVYMDTSIDVAPDGKLYRVVKGEATEINWNVNDVPYMYVSAYAIQTEGFKNVDEAYAAYTAQWTTEAGENNGLIWADPAKNSVTVDVADSEAFKAAVTTDAQIINVNLTENVTYDVAAWQNNAMGGETTKRIVINGNGNTITFNQTNSDWNNIVTNNGATLVLNDVVFTSEGHNDGPWNRHDLNFACDVEMTKVTSNRAMAFKAGAKLTNVTINDKNTVDTYAIWIQPNGQTVTLESCTIDMLECSDGRGLKIDEQYVDEPGKVTLVVKNTTFKTEEKGAIIVKSKAGADITLSNVNITEVAEDSTSPVWVDEASAAYYDLVTVTGGTKHQE